MTQMIIKMLEPTVANLTALGLFDKLVAYGFDEFCGRPALPSRGGGWPRSGCPGNQTIYELFGALQAKWPGLKTMATLQHAIHSEYTGTFQHDVNCLRSYILLSTPCTITWDHDRT
jgi:hypothetical protein